MRVVVMGNSGAGKSTFAARLAGEHALAHLDLDTLAWLPTTPPHRPRSPTASRSSPRSPLPTRAG